MIAPDAFEPPAGRLSLYVHVPFCEKKCPYCAFESRVPEEGDKEGWLDSLNMELKWWERRLGRPELETCYFGGGTPTVIGPTLWTALTEMLERYFSFADGAEVTVEANPNSLSADHLLLWRDWRVSRLSIGVQSFDDAELAMLGRLHNSARSYEVISASLAAGFSVSADLMFGLPGQTLKNWGRTLKEAVASGLHHVSLYQLSLEPGTPWGSMSADLLSDGYPPYRWAQWYMPRKGYRQYEIANFARPGRESRHNLNYWEEGDYLGIGPGASGCLSGLRYKNISDPGAYSAILKNGGSAIAAAERLTGTKRASEAAVLALRMAKGIDAKVFKQKYGVDEWLRITETFEKIPDGLYLLTESGLRLTPKGMRVANMIWAELI